MRDPAVLRLLQRVGVEAAEIRVLLESAKHLGAVLLAQRGSERKSGGGRYQALRQALALRAAAAVARLAVEKREADGLPEPPRREGMETDLVQRVSAVAERDEGTDGERGVA